MLTKQILQLIEDYTTPENASAPNAISDAVFEKLVEAGIDEAKATKISDAVFELTSELVKEPPFYM